MLTTPICEGTYWTVSPRSQRSRQGWHAWIYHLTFRGEHCSLQAAPPAQSLSVCHCPRVDGTMVIRFHLLREAETQT